MNYPQDLKYAKTHEWVKVIDEKTVLIGLTDFAQDALGELVFVKLPEVGDSFKEDECFAEVESVKAVSEVYCPLSGEVTKINEELMDAPELVNQDPYGAWMIQLSGVEGLDGLLTAEEYEEVCAKEA